MAFFGSQPNAQQIAEMAVDAGKRVVGAILRLIDAKKHTKGKPYSVSIEGNENRVVSSRGHQRIGQSVVNRQAVGGTQMNFTYPRYDPTT